MVISIVVPIYNTEKYLKKCLDSIINQTYKELEIILIDDGSTDGSEKICDEYALNDNRVHVIHKVNEGVSIARINGVEQATGEYITFVDSDDYISNNAVEILVNQQRKTSSDLIIGQLYESIDNNIIERNIEPDIGEYCKNDITRFLNKNFLIDKLTFQEGMMGYLVGKLYKKDFLEKAIQTGKDLFFAEDKLILFHVLMLVNSMAVISNRIYYYVRREGSATKSYNRKIWENFDLFFKKLDELDKNMLLKKQVKYYRLEILFYLINKEINKSNTIWNKKKFLNNKSDNILFRTLYENDFYDIGVKRLIKVMILKQNIVLYILLIKIKYKIKLIFS